MLLKSCLYIKSQPKIYFAEKKMKKINNDNDDDNDNIETTTTRNCVFGNNYIILLKGEKHFLTFYPG